MQADGSRDRVLVERVSPCSLDWSPDGRRLAYSAPSPACGEGPSDTSGAFVVDATTGERKGVFAPTDGGQVVGVVWSADGRRLVINVGRDGNCLTTGPALADLWIVNADGSEPRQLIRAADCQWAEGPDW